MANKMTKLLAPYKWYYKSMINGKCPMCQSQEISTSRDKEIIWCNGWGGTYVTTDTCEQRANEKEGDCNECCEWDFKYRVYPNETVMVCENCQTAINFETQKVSKTRL